MRKITVTILGGGSAQARILTILLAVRGLLQLDGIDLEINSVVAVADDGGSTGVIRELFGGPAVGDIVNIMAAVARNRQFANTISARYGEDAGQGLKGHKLGNLILERAWKTLPGGLPEAIAMLSAALDCQANIYPSSLDSPHLCIRLSTGEVICGEHHLDAPQHNGDLAIVDVWLDPAARIHPDAGEAIRQSDKILISAGDPYGSIAAVCKVDGIPEAIDVSGASIAMFVPLFNRYGQSTGWNAGDHIRFTQSLVSPAVLTDAYVDISQVSAGLTQQYAEEKEDKVPNTGFDGLANVHVYRGHYLDETPKPPQPGDTVRRSSLLARHGEGVIQDLKDFLVR